MMDPTNEKRNQAQKWSKPRKAVETIPMLPETDEEMAELGPNLVDRIQLRPKTVDDDVPNLADDGPSLAEPVYAWSKRVKFGRWQPIYSRRYPAYFIGPSLIDITTIWVHEDRARPKLGRTRWCSNCCWLCPMRSGRSSTMCRRCCFPRPPPWNAATNNATTSRTNMSSRARSKRATPAQNAIRQRRRDIAPSCGKRRKKRCHADHRISI